MDKTEVFVGTLHKSKGKEFDTVILDLQGLNEFKKDIIHLIYVGLTRAKQNVYILVDKTNVFWFKKVWGNEIQIENIENLKQMKEYETYFGLEDVYLDFNKYIDIASLDTSKYTLSENIIKNSNQEIQKLSKKGYSKIKNKKILKIDIYAQCFYKNNYANLPIFTLQL